MTAPAEGTPAVVLRTRPVRESDLIVVLLTPRRGRLETIARGARRSRRRFPGGLPVGARGEASVAQDRGSLLRLDGFVLLADHSVMGRDLTAFAYVAYMCELTDQLVVGSQSDPRAFAVLCTALDLALSGTPSPLHLRRFELGLLDCLGMLPTFGHCCVCGTEIPEPGAVAYDGERGGVLCPAHAGGARGLDPVVLEACRALVAGDPDPLATASAAQRRGVRDLALDLLRRHLRRPLRSLEFFAQIAGVSAPSGPEGG